MNPKAKKSQGERRGTQGGVKVHSYYTLPNRGAGRPELDGSRRGVHTPNRSLIPRPRLSALLRGFIGAALVVMLMYTLRLTTNPVILIDTNPSLGRTEAYQNGIQTILGDSILYRSKLTFRRDEFINSVRSEFPEIEIMTVTTPFLGSRPVVHIREAQMLFRLESNAVTYAVSDGGVVVGEAQNYALPARSVTIRDESGVEINKGARVVRSDDAEFFTRANAILAAKGRVLQTVRITSVPREAYLLVKDLPYSLRVYLDDSADTQMATFFAAEKTLGGRGETPSSYMDLRAGEKVFWQ